MKGGDRAAERAQRTGRKPKPRGRRRAEAEPSAGLARGRGAAETTAGGAVGYGGSSDDGDACVTPPAWARQQGHGPAGAVTGRGKRGSTRLCAAGGGGRRDATRQGTGTLPRPYRGSRGGREAGGGGDDSMRGAARSALALRAGLRTTRGWANRAAIPAGGHIPERARTIRTSHMEAWQATQTNGCEHRRRKRAAQQERKTTAHWDTITKKWQRAQTKRQKTSKKASKNKGTNEIIRNKPASARVS